VKYAEARSRIKTGDMLLWRDHNGGTVRSMVERWIVRHGTASPYTHVGVAWVDNGRVWVMDITTRGCAPRLLSTCLPFDWAAAPEPLSADALAYAFSCFGQWTYSRWQAVMGAAKRLTIGVDTKGQCAEYTLAIYRANGNQPTAIATPGDCADGAMLVWGIPIFTITGETN